MSDLMKEIKEKARREIGQYYKKFYQNINISEKFCDKIKLNQNLFQTI